MKLACKIIATPLGPMLLAASDVGLARKQDLLRLEGVLPRPLQ